MCGDGHGALTRTPVQPLLGGGGPGDPQDLDPSFSSENQMDKNTRRLRNLDTNPCTEESDASQKCLDHYNYDKSMCSIYFQRYKNCRKYWHNIMVQRRRDGVKPDMPTASERLEMLNSIGGKPY